MKKIPWYRKIQFQIPAVVFLTFLIPSVMFLFYDQTAAKRAAVLRMQTTLREQQTRTALLMQNTMEEIEDITKKLSEDEAFLQALADYFVMPEDGAARSRLLLLLGQTAWPNSQVEYLYLAAEGSETVLLSDPVKKQIRVEPDDWKLFGNEIVRETGWSPYTDKEEKTIRCQRVITDSRSGHFCILGCVLKTEYLERNTEELRELSNGISRICDYQGKVLYQCGSGELSDSSADEWQLFAAAFDGSENSGQFFTSRHGGRWMTVYTSSLEDGWKYCTAIPKSQIYGSETGLRLLPVLLGAGLCSLLAGSLILYRLVIFPLLYLQKQLEKMERGELEAISSVQSGNEIGRVLHSYNHMIGELKRLIDENYVQQLLRKQAELSSLQSQVDEHFLYNTLNSIYCKAGEEGAPISAAMLLRLSRYFRLSLSKGQEKIALTEIEELIRTYLQIVQMRYGAGFHCQIETFPEMDRYISLKWLYQPIVENAIVHGFEKKTDSHSLEIRFEAEDGILRFIVRDDGVGMSEEQVKQVTEQMRTFEPVRGKGYALRNIAEQINIVYGESYGITIDSRPGEGTTVILAVPLERRP